ncbi:MAG: MBL fold metallo-hydrolase [Thermoleophilia bacterium]|nr:MBL fold metallo-hydrolase [Thermoleophilia bacterium]
METATFPGGIRRVTLPFPSGVGHVHAYLVPGDDGWMVVDTGLGLPDARERWATELAAIEGPVARVFITHFHPDHCGAAEDVAELTGAPILQGALDAEQCRRVWGTDGWEAVVADWFHRHGAPDAVTRELVEQGSSWKPFIRWPRDPILVEPGADVAGWTTVAAPGHADGQLMLLRDGILLAADHLLSPITPTVGLWPASRPDPLADYLAALASIEELEPVLALSGHGEVITDPVGRARAIAAHHAERLEEISALLSPEEPRSAYTVSLSLWGRELKPAQRRFAIAEALSHLERLVALGGAQRVETTGTVAYTPV